MFTSCWYESVMVNSLLQVPLFLFRCQRVLRREILSPSLLTCQMSLVMVWKLTWLLPSLQHQEQQVSAGNGNLLRVHEEPRKMLNPVSTIGIFVTKSCNCHSYLLTETCPSTYTWSRNYKSLPNVLCVDAQVSIERQKSLFSLKQSK